MSEPKPPPEDPSPESWRRAFAALDARRKTAPLSEFYYPDDNGVLRHYKNGVLVDD